MAHQYAKIAFTETVRQVQQQQNSRAGYAGMDTGEDYNYLLSQNEASFIAERDSFYMASVSETNWPYVQHRGGPSGFLKVLDENTLGFADYKGNRQYVSTGNFRTNDKVSIILMDYPNRRRLKILGHITQVDAQDWQTLAALEDDHYRVTVERGFVIKIVAFDWNCPQHISPRFTEQELTSLISPLEAEISSLKSQLSNINPIESSTILGDGKLPLVITGIRQLTPDIRAYELRSANGESLPIISAGSHIEVPVLSPSKQLIWRHYSISSNPARRDCYEISVKKETNGNGGSQALHQTYQLGLTINCKFPNNHFPLVQSNQHSVLIAGGIGITAIKSMALALLKEDASFEVHYAGRTTSQMAYTDRLEKQLGDRLHLYPSQEGKKLSLSKLFTYQEPNTHYYFCGPNPMLDDFKMLAKAKGITDNHIHFEKFSITTSASAKACKLTLTESNIEVEVTAQQTLLEAVLNAGVDVPYSCMAGDCKSCVVKVAKGSNVEHLDDCLTAQERATGKMCLCVSRPNTTQLTIEL